MKSLTGYYTLVENRFGNMKYHVPIFGQSGPPIDQSIFYGTRGRRLQKPVYHEKFVGAGTYSVSKNGQWIVSPNYDGGGTWKMWKMGEKGTVAFGWNANTSWQSPTRANWAFTFSIATGHVVRNRLRSSTRYNGYPDTSCVIGYHLEEGILIRNDIDAVIRTSQISGNTAIAVRRLFERLPVIIHWNEKGKDWLSFLHSLVKESIGEVLGSFEADIAANLTRQVSGYRYLQNCSPVPYHSMNLFLEDLRWEGYPVMHPSNYWVNYGTQHSFLDACQNVPRMNDNNISNLLELCGFIYSIVVKHQIDMPKSLASAWLAYRYSYSTTKLDIQEAIHFVDRHLPDDIWSVGYKAYGQHTFDYKGISVQFRCTSILKRKDVDLIHQLWLKLTEYGLAPDFYVLWDMIPYSFIVDWFIPVGDVLAAESAALVYNDEYYEFSDLVYSIKYTFVGDDGLYRSVYYRWIEETPPSLQGFYWFERRSPSDSTLIKRCIDGLALIVS